MAASNYQSMMAQWANLSPAEQARVMSEILGQIDRRLREAGV